jgi:hypothetical protein
MVNFKKLRKMIEVQGNGNIISKEISVSTFVRLHLGCKGVTELYQGEEEKVIIEADENLMEHCAATNAGRTLFVSTGEGARKPVFTHCVVKVFLRQLNILYVRNNGGDVICPNELILKDPLEITIQSVGNTELNITAPSVKILNQSNGNLTLKGSTGKLDIKNQAKGDLNASQFKAGELNIKNMAYGNVLLHADDSISISHFGKGFIHFSGDANVKDVKQYGNGEIKHQ